MNIPIFKFKPVYRRHNFFPEHVSTNSKVTITDGHVLCGSVLQIACAYGHLDIVKELIAASADIHSGDDRALRWASANGHLDIVKELIAAGANIHTGNDSALRWASTHNHIELIKELIKYGCDKSIALANITDELVKKQIEEFNPITRIKRARQ